MEGPDSLEGWVALKPGIFSPTPPGNSAKFAVGWNFHEKKFAVTYLEGERWASDCRCKSHATMASLDDLRNIHQQLALVFPSLDTAFPLEVQKSSVMLLSVFGSDPLPETVCEDIERYLYTALEVCGEKFLFAILFEEEDSLSDYEENIHEFKLKSYERTLEKAYQELDEVLALREKAENMLEMATVYALEDEVVANISIALAEQYNFQLQPFLELREVAHSSIKTRQNELDNPHLGEKIKQKAKLKLEEWEDQYLSATEALQQLYHEYYRKTVDLVTGQRNRMAEDQKKFGKSSFEIQALNRLQKLDVFVSQEKLKLLGAVKATLEFQQAKIKQKKEILSEEGNSNSVHLDDEIYETQIGIFDIKLEMLQEEEKLLQKQKAILEKAWQDELDEGIFYDAVEDVDDVDEAEDDSGLQTPKAQKLKVKLSKLYRKRAIIRNRKKACVAEHEKKMKIKELQKTNFKQHHTVHTRRQEYHKQVEVNKEKINEERRKTLQRLRQYKKKYSEKQSNTHLRAYEGCSVSEKENLIGDLAAYPSLRIEDNPEDESGNERGDIQENGLSCTSSRLSPVPTSTSLPLPPPPPPPPPASLPPPPPPPPPPLPLVMPPFQASTTSLNCTIPLDMNKNNMKRSCNFEAPKPKGKGGFGSQGLDLTEILFAKTKLRKTLPINSLESTDQKRLAADDFSVVLKATLQKIKGLTQESDESDDNSGHSDFEE